jgi:hypothetical protein
LKITNTEKGWWREAQVVECLPSKPEALSSNLSIAKKKAQLNNLLHNHYQDFKTGKH